MQITEDMIKKTCSAMIYKRGSEYFNGGRVHMRKRSGDEISAVVDDEELYTVSVKFGENGIKSSFCTCPYFETMHSTCKHMVALMRQYCSEINEVAGINDENDRIAATLCGEFVDSYEKKKARAHFTLYTKHLNQKYPTFEMSVSLPEYGGELGGLESFLDCYLRGREYKLDRSTTYSKRTMYFPEAEDAVIAILAEVYETRSADVGLYRRSSERTSFGASALKRILPYLARLDFKLVHDGVVTNNARVIAEDPDIVIDVSVYGREIALTVSDRGFAMTPDGEWFIYNDVIYHTSREWQSYFMPIYHSLGNGERTQVTFSGDNTMLFAMHVLPRLRGRHGVVITGVENLIVDDRPRFEVCLDSVNRNITAVVVAKYGDIKFRIPTEQSESSAASEKIIIRRPDAENEILGFFNKFDRERSVFTLVGNANIYNFMTTELPELKKKAELILSDRFKRMRVLDNRDVRLNAAYRYDIDFLEVGFETDMSAEELRGVLAAMRRNALFYRFSDGSYLSLRHNKRITALRMLERFELTNEDIERGRKILPKYHLPYLSSLDWVGKDASVMDYMRELSDIQPAIPEGLHGVLRPYQEDGIKWFTQLSAGGMGGILADDMGLGKTVQVLAYVHGIKPKRPTLIVAPSTLTYNWQREIEKFIPDAKSIIISGSQPARRKLIKTIDEYEFVITSYPLMRRDIMLYSMTKFEYCFLDEAQYIKNAKTMNAVSVKRIRAQHRFALSGTPIENSLMELWSIFDFIMPGYLRTAQDFRERYEIPAVREGDADASDNLRNIIRPFVLRRMKKDVLDELPEKIETTMMCDLNREQKALYTEYLSDARDRARGIFREHGSRLLILTLLLRLRQICCHPKLFNGEYVGGSGKLDLLMELTESGLGSGHRILVFSQFRSMLDIIVEKLQKAGIEYFYIHGSTPLQDRSDMAARFNDGEREVFLVSLKAGGTGLNLIGADMVIHYDPWWNPAVTDQATDRAYRIGQTNSVQVIKLASRGTIEEKILQLQEKKRTLADDIIRVNTDTLAALTEEEIMSLFDL